MDKREHPAQRLLAHAVKAMEPLGLQFRVMRPETRDGDHRADAISCEPTAASPFL